MKKHSLNVLGMIANELRADGSKIVLSIGCFDLLHIGHIQHLKAAKDLGDVLIVLVTPDGYVNKGPGRPRFHQYHRMGGIEALECVDYVALNETPTAAPAIRLIYPHIFAKGVEYRDHKTPQIIEEEKAVQDVKGEIVFTGGVVFSSTELLKELSGATGGREAHTQSR